MRIATALAISLIISSHGFSADVTKTVPKETTMVIRADWQQLRNSILATEIIDSNVEKFTSAMEGIKTATGVDLDDISRVWVLAEKQNSGAIIIEGKMGAEGIRAQIGKNADVQFLEHPLFDTYAEYTEHKQPKILAAKEGLALAGNRAYTLKLLQAMADESDSITDSTALTHLSKDTNTIAIAMLQVNDELRTMNPDIAGLLKQGNMGMTITDTVTAELSLETNAPDQAEGLQMMAQGMIALQRAKLQQMTASSDQFPAEKVREANALASMMKTLKISRDGATIGASWSLSEEAHGLIKDALKAKKEAEAPIAVP